MSSMVKRFRILAIEVRRQRIGYVVFEEAQTLLDWGVRGFGNDGSDLDRKLAKLLKSFGPTIILFSRSKEAHHQHSGLLELPIQIIKKRARAISIPATPVSKLYLKQYFTRIGRFNKHDIAHTIASHFPHLAWQIPPRRKPWESEPNKQVVFDAASIAFLYFTADERNHLLSQRAIWSAPDDE